MQWQPNPDQPNPENSPQTEGVRESKNLGKKSKSSKKQSNTAPTSQTTAPSEQREEKNNKTDDVLNTINDHMVLSPGHKRTAMEDEGVIPDSQEEHLFSVDEDAKLDEGDALSEGDVKDNEKAEPTKDANYKETTTGPSTTPGKKHNNNNSKPKPKLLGLTLASIRETISVLTPPSNQATIHRVPTAFPRTSNSLEHRATSKFIYDALMDLGIELHQVSLDDATPVSQRAVNNTLELITLSFDSKETKDKALKAAEKKGKKGVGSFPTLGKLKYYFTETKERSRSSGNTLDSSPDPPVESNPEVAKLCRQAQLDQNLTQRNKIELPPNLTNRD